MKTFSLTTTLVFSLLLMVGPKSSAQPIHDGIECYVGSNAHTRIGLEVFPEYDMVQGYFSAQGGRTEYLSTNLRRVDYADFEANKEFKVIYFDGNSQENDGIVANSGYLHVNGTRVLSGTFSFRGNTYKITHCQWTDM
jgi:hypothetical protein